MAKRALLLILIICLTAAAVCAESVVRELPDEPVGAEDAVTVRLTQEGFIYNASGVSEMLPDGFVYMYDSFTGDQAPTYYTNNNTLVMQLAGEDGITETYTVIAGTLEQIGNAKFNGTYQGFVGGLDEEHKKSGFVTGDDILTPVEPTPAPYDLNGDGTVTPVDALIALEMASGNCAPDGNADVSGDDKVTSLDALMLLQVAANNISI